jgi:hypothetical protein
MRSYGNHFSDKAKEMFERGFTEQQIGKHLGFSQATIAGDLRGLSIVDKPSRL